MPQTVKAFPAEFPTATDLPYAGQLRRAQLDDQTVVTNRSLQIEVFWTVPGTKDRVDYRRQLKAGELPGPDGWYFNCAAGLALKKEENASG